jgi:hypothetical protein
MRARRGTLVDISGDGVDGISVLETIADEVELLLSTAGGMRAGKGTLEDITGGDEEGLLVLETIADDV